MSSPGVHPASVSRTRAGSSSPFASLNGARFYGLQTNPGTIVLKRQPGLAIAAVAVDGEEVVGFRGGENMTWSIGEVRP